METACPGNLQAWFVIRNKYLAAELFKKKFGMGKNVERMLEI